MSTPSHPLVSVIVLYWNSAKHIRKCLDSLALQGQDPEVILIDNGSQDEYFNQLPAIYSRQLNIHLEHLPGNLGFAAANNIGARLAHGKWIALLNADAYPQPDWLENLLYAAETNPGYSAFSSRQIQFNMPELLDGAGDAYHVSGLAWRNGYQLPAKDHGLDSEEVFSACGAAALYLREAFLNMGGFDEDYFSYFEDVDLGFRFRLRGEKSLYVPGAVVHHVGSASTGKRSDFSVYYGYRNMIWTFVKDMPSPLIWMLLPLHIGALLFFISYLTSRGQGRVIIKAIRDAIGGVPRMLEKRRVIQKNKVVQSGDLLKVMSRGILEPYREFIRRYKRPDGIL